MRKEYIIAAAAMAAGAYVYYRSRTEAGTAGDAEANIFEDGMDAMTSKIKQWPDDSEPYRKMIESAASLSGVPVMILAWLLWKESRYNQAIISGAKKSPVGAMGIAQFMPKTAKQELGSEAAALNPALAIPGAARYLKKLYISLGTWERALAAYNWGIGNIQKKGMDAAPAETRDYYTTIIARAGMGGATA